VQCFQESRGDGDKPLVGPIMPGERLVEGKRGMAELLMCLPVRQAEITLLLFLPYEASGKAMPWESNPCATPSPPREGVSDLLIWYPLLADESDQLWMGGP
jgi:hypothetical protein